MSLFTNVPPKEGATRMDPEDVHNFGIKLNIYNPDEDEDPSDFKRVSKEETEKEEEELKLKLPNREAVKN